MKTTLFNKKLINGAKKKIVAKIKKTLFEQDSILFAYLFGSFAENRNFHDIDIAVFIDETKIANDDFFQLQLSLASKIDLLIKGYEIDLQCLNNAPLPFRFQVINKGNLLFSKSESIITAFVAKTRDLYFDFKPHLDFYYQKIVLEKK